MTITCALFGWLVAGADLIWEKIPYCWLVDDNPVEHDDRHGTITGSQNNLK
jgi:hypothetical protein